MKIKEIVARAEICLKSAKGKLWGEAAIYGTLATVYTSLFFFGALYPGYGIPSQSIEYEEDVEKEKSDTMQENDSEHTDIKFKSLLWEQLKEWF